MATPQQVFANISNSQHSTGPVSDAGKRISRMNAYKHGLTGQMILATPEEHAAFVAYSARLMPDLAPRTALETVHAERIIADSWRLDRAVVIERAMFELVEITEAIRTGDASMDENLHQAAAFDAQAKSFNLMSLYMSRIRRGIRQIWTC